MTFSFYYKCGSMKIEMLVIQTQTREFWSDWAFRQWKIRVTVLGHSRRWREKIICASEEATRLKLLRTPSFVVFMEDFWFSNQVLIHKDLNPSIVPFWSLFSWSTFPRNAPLFKLCLGTGASSGSPSISGPIISFLSRFPVSTLCSALFPLLFTLHKFTTRVLLRVIEVTLRRPVTQCTEQRRFSFNSVWVLNQ